MTVRSLTTGPDRIRALIDPSMRVGRAKEGDDECVTGYASVFGVEYDIGYGTKEIIERGAFTKTLIENAGKIAALDSHDYTKPLARMGVVGRGCLECYEDDRGLCCRINPTDTSYARDLMANLRAAVIRSMSFGFDVVNEKYERVNGQLLCRVTEVRLWEVSPILWPASNATECMVEERSLVQRIKKARASLGMPEDPDAAPAPKRQFFLPPRRR